MATLLHLGSSPSWGALDYYISVDKSLLKDGMTAGGALEFKLKVSIGIDVKGEGDYSQDQKNILEKTETLCK